MTTNNQPEQDRQIRSFFTAVMMSTTGNWMTSLVIFGWVFGVTKSPFWVAVAIMSHRLPNMFGSFAFSPAAGIAPCRVHSSFDFTRVFILLGMAAVIAIEPHAPQHAILAVVVFLILAGLRSLFSGADAAAQATVVSSEAKDNRELAGRRQQSLSTILGVSGFIASLLFTVGTLSISLIGVLLFDVMTFLVSGLFFLRFSHKRNETRPKLFLLPKSHRNILKTVWHYPGVTFLFAAHFLRTIGTAVGLQQWLLLLQVKFKMGTAAMGYLYMAVTSAWFMSAHISRRLQIKLTIVQFIALSLIVCVLVPIGWQTTTVLEMILLTFIIGFLDGTMLATIGADLQKMVKSDRIADVFGSLAIFTQVAVVGGSLLIGDAAVRFGYSRGSILIADTAAALLLILLFAYIIIEPFVDWLWRKTRLSKLGVHPRFTYQLTHRLEEYLDVQNRNSQSVPVSEAGCTIIEDGRELSAGAVLINPHNTNKSEYNALNLAMYEALERLGALRYYKSRGESAPLPLSNGFAIHHTFELASRNARLEILERDSILAHYYCSKSPACRLSRDALFKSPITDPLLGTKSIADCEFFGFPTADVNFAAWACRIRADGVFSLGFGISKLDSIDGLEKSFSEAVATYRFYKVEKLSRLRSAAAEGSIRPRTRADFDFFMKMYNVSPNALQMAQILLDPSAESRLSFLERAIPCDTYGSAVEKLKSDLTSTRLPELEITATEINFEFLGDLVLVRSLSDLAVCPMWPMIPASTLEKVFAERFKNNGWSLGPNVNEPCLIY